jgi:hypothetical protein
MREEKRMRERKGGGKANERKRRASPLEGLLAFKNKGKSE